MLYLLFHFSFAVLFAVYVTHLPGYFGGSVFSHTMQGQADESRDDEISKRDVTIDAIEPIALRSMTKADAQNRR